jgi:outer membrane lipoprotein carrier protein
MDRMTCSMNRKLLLMLTGAVLLLAASPLLAVGSARAALHDFLKDVEVFDSRFEQTVTERNGELGEESSGSVSLAVPQRFRFEYVEPYPQLILADGERVWVYDPELEQATVRLQASAEAQSPLTLILQPEALEESFVVTEGGQEDGLDWLLLAPKEERSDFDRLDLGFADSELRQMRYVDPTGQSTRLTFAGWRRNPELGADHFRFEPPVGVDVIGLEEIEAGAAQVQGLSD